MFGFLNGLISHIMDIINSLGYFGIAAGMFLESARVGPGRQSFRLERTGILGNGAARAG